MSSCSDSRSFTVAIRRRTSQASKVARKRSSTGRKYGAETRTSRDTGELPSVSRPPLEQGLHDLQVELLIHVPGLLAVDGEQPRIPPQAMARCDEGLPPKEIQTRVLLVHERQVLRSQPGRGVWG